MNPAARNPRHARRFLAARPAAPAATSISTPFARSPVARAIPLLALLVASPLLALPAAAGPADAPAKPAAAAPLSWEVGELRIKPLLSDRVRAELVNWFDPGPGAGDEDYGFVANVLRFGAVAEWRELGVTLEGQEVELWGVPSDAAGLGPGASYYAATSDQDQRELFLRRAVMQWKPAAVRGLALSGGRSILNDGAETAPADASLGWLKKQRISQRLIGGFDYTHAGRSIDGATASWQAAPWNLTVAGGRPTAGGFNINGNTQLDEVGLLYAAASLTEPAWLPRSDARLFYIYYSDDRDVVATDNRALATRQADGGNIAVHTVGANAEMVRRAGPGDVDALAWVAGQGGDWETQDHGAWAIALEGGYRLVDVKTKPWLRMGWARGSGDDDDADGNHATFFQVLPTARLYALTPFYNMMNNQDFFLQLVLQPLETMNVRVDWHRLWATEGGDLVYSGAGASQKGPAFGYAGYSARGNSGIGDLLDLSLEWSPVAHARVGLYYGHVFGDAAIRDQYAGGDDADYAYLEVTLAL